MSATASQERERRLREIAERAALDSEHAVAFPDHRLGPGGFDIILAALLRVDADAREECAKLCDNIAAKSIDDHEAGGAYECAAAIRAGEG